MSKSAIISDRVKNLQPSATIALDTEMKRRMSAGEKIINLTAGEPDFDTPPSIKNTIKKALDEGKTKYTDPRGILPLRQALSGFIKNEFGMSYDPNDIVVCAGAKQGLFAIFQALINPGDEILIPIPAWVSYVEQVKLCGGIPVLVSPGPNFDLNFEELERAITKKTKAIIINSPNNPTGKMYDQAQLEKLAEFCKQHDIFIVSDEMYSCFAYSKAHYSIATHSEDAFSRTFFVHGFSKTYAMTGLRLGYIAGPKTFMKAIADFQSQCIGNPSSITQEGGIIALQEKDAVKQMVAEFKRRRDTVESMFREIPELTLAPIDGAFYAFFNVTKLDQSSVQFCQKLLEKTLVGVVPGVAFSAEGWVRLSFSKSVEILQEALGKIKEFVKNY